MVTDQPRSVRDAIGTAAEILDILSSNIPPDHTLYAWAKSSAKAAVSDLYEISRLEPAGQLELFA